jgi:hypothetical protein
MDAIDQPAAGDLQRRISPPKRREHHTKLHWIQFELPGDAGRGDREVAAVEIVDHHGNEQQHHNQEAPARCSGCHGCGQRRLLRGRHDNLAVPRRSARTSPYSRADGWRKPGGLRHDGDSDPECAR